METKHPNIIPVTKWNERYDWPPIGGMRHLIFNAETNGFSDAFLRAGGRVLVDVDCFWSIVEKQGRAEK